MKTQNVKAEAVSHTPGPWEARSCKNMHGDIWIDCEAYRNAKAGTGPLGGTVATAWGTGTGKGTVEANARLIAAAPDMLEALEVVGGLIAAHLNHESIEMCAFAEALQSIHSAISNAKGGGK